MRFKNDRHGEQARSLFIRLFFITVFLLPSVMIFSQCYSGTASDYAAVNGGQTPVIHVANTDMLELTLPAAYWYEDYSFTFVQPGTPCTGFTFMELMCPEGFDLHFDPALHRLSFGAVDYPPFDFEENQLTADIRFLYQDGEGADMEFHVMLTVPLERRPVKIVLVLDQSGSMSQQGCDLPSGSLSRWQSLDSAVFDFILPLVLFARPDDELGITYFSTDPVQPGAPMGSGFLPVDASLPAIIESDISLHGPTFTTAIGKALLDARAKLLGTATGNDSKFILLFTDGEQNVSPFVSDDGRSVLTPGTATLLNENHSNPRDSISIYTVGTGDYIPQAHDLLQSIAANNYHGVYLATQSEGLCQWIDAYFSMNMTSFLREGSPQLICSEKGVFSSAPVRYRINVNKGTGKLVFKLFAGNTGGLNLRLYKDNKEVTDNLNLIRGAQSIFRVLDEGQGQSTVDASGEWTVEISGQPGVPYIMTALTDDHHFRLQCGVSSEGEVGEPLKLSADLSYRGRPVIPGDFTVEAVITKPVTDVGDLLANTSLDGDPHSFTDVSAVKAKYLNLLYSNDEFIARLLNESDTILLAETCEGHYEGLFTQTEETGIYSVDFIVTGTHESAGTIERTMSRSYHFLFGKTDLKKSVNTLVFNPKDRSAVLTMKLINRFGYSISPGVASWFAVSAEPNDVTVGDVSDNMDGSYTLVLGQIDDPKDVKVVLSLHGDTWYEGRLDRLGGNGIELWMWLLLILLLIMIILKYIKPNWMNSSFSVTVLWIFFLVWLLYLVLLFLGIL